MFSHLKNIARVIKYSLKNKIRTTFPRKIDTIRQVVISLLPHLTCIDVGASYFPHPAWEIFRRSKLTQWLAIDPNAANLSYLKNWQWPAQVLPVGEALSESGQESTLYITNIDSGSSLLKPEINLCMEHRVDKHYFFPLKEKNIGTTTLDNVFQSHNICGPTLIKLDTQGSEFHILRGLSEYLILGSVVCIELEATLLAQPVHIGSSRFYDIQRKLEELGFELVCLSPISLTLPKVNQSLQSRYPLNECDAVFMLRPDILENRPIEHRLAVLGCYVAYNFYGEALNLIRTLYKEENKELNHELKKLELLIK